MNTWFWIGSMTILVLALIAFLMIFGKRLIDMPVVEEEADDDYDEDYDAAARARAEEGILLYVLDLY